MEKWKKLFMVATMALLAGAGIKNYALAADTFSSTARTEENKIMVTAKSNQADHDIPIATTIITSEEIAAANASSIKDVLIEQAGINFGVNNSSEHGRKNISIRGSATGHVLILVDGKKVSGSDAQIGHSDFEYNWVPMSAIERIEVIKGPASSIYGSQGIGGVVNIITKKSYEKFSGEVDVSYGDSRDDGGDEFKLGLNVGGQVADRLSLFMSAERIDRDPSRDKDDGTETKIEGKEINNGLARIRFDIDDTQYIEASYGQGNEDRIKIDNILHHDIERKNYSVGYNKAFNSVTLDVDAYVTDSETHYTTTSATGGYAHDMTDSVIRGEVDIAAVKNHYIVTGAEFKNQEYEKAYDKAASSDKNFANDMDNTALFLQDEINITEALIITLGTRYDYHEKFNGEWSPKIGALYKLGAHHRIRANYGEGFMAPTVTQNSSSYAATAMKGVTIYGNDDLQPESSKSYELGYEFFTDNTEFKVSVYKTDVENLIDTKYLPGSSDEKMYVNVDSATLQGFECELSRDITQNYSIRIGYQYLDTEDDSTGEELENRPRHTVNVRLNATLPWDIHATVGANYTDEQIDDEEQCDDFIVFNAQVSKTFYDRISLRLGIDNISDEDLNDKPYDIEGRMFYAGVNFKF
ncbi:TonB-dependent receptor domain-containing protein [uncultured Desulfobacter sp.]|uniref:TonB-dependent receptor plug domain-containing protein n=1 Tax=uncultured Desulfobacter sp. TaxID=240139 RepID=UPI0029F5506C|nr:TonB-dependent receptor [uncultured Desulfobacter sp.]